MLKTIIAPNIGVNIAICSILRNFLGTSFLINFDCEVNQSSLEIAKDVTIGEYPEVFPHDIGGSPLGVSDDAYQMVAPLTTKTLAPPNSKAFLP